MSQETIVKAVRMASALVKKGEFDNRQIRKIVNSKFGIKLNSSTVAGIKRSYVYQAGRALSLVM